MAEDGTGEAPHEILRFATLRPGPRLLVMGAVHGNETCGPNAIRRAAAEIRSGEIALRRGQLTLVPVANPKAYRLGAREGDRNLNRDFGEHPLPLSYEDRVGNVLAPLLREQDAILDLHSYTAPAEPFVFAGPDDNGGEVEPFRREAEEWDLATRLGVEIAIHGWLDGYARHLAERARLGFPPLPATEGIGTTEYVRFAGGYGVTLECSRHGEPEGDEVAYRGIRRALAWLGLTDEPRPDRTVTRAMRIVDSLLCEQEGDRIAEGLRTADPVAAGTPIAQRADGSVVRMERDGYVVFPNATAKPGQQLCYIAVPSERPLA